MSNNHSVNVKGTLNVNYSTTNWFSRSFYNGVTKKWWIYVRFQVRYIISISDVNFTPEALYEPRHDKTNKMSVRPAKTQISLGIRPVWSVSSLCAQWVAKDLSFLHADSEDSDQTGRMPWLTRVFTGRTLILLVLSCRGSIILCNYYLIS